jgi:hypothetical protein
MSSPPPAVWPRSHLEVLTQAQQWSDPAWVVVNEAALRHLPPGTILAPNLPACIRPSGARRLTAAAVIPQLVWSALHYQLWAHDAQEAIVPHVHQGRRESTALRTAFHTAWNDPAHPLHHVQRRPLRVADLSLWFGPLSDLPGRRRLLQEMLGSSVLTDWAHWFADQVSLDHPHMFTTTVAAQLTDHFPEALGDGLLAKAQRALAQLWLQARDKGYPHAARLTAVADDQLPSVLHALGLLRYAPALTDRLRAGDLLSPHGPEERAVRGATVLAMEHLAQTQGLNTVDVEQDLREHQLITRSHRTLTTAY